MMGDQTMENKPRWQCRFDNFRRTYVLLQEICARYQQEELEQIAKEGMIRRFNFCMELAWKTIKDYMEYQNVVFAQNFPSHIIKEAYAAKLIGNAEAWLDALDDRNKLSHTYNFKTFEKVIARVSTSYIHCFGELYEKLAVEVMEQEK